MCRTATQGSTPECQYAERLSGIAAASCICDRRCVAHGGGEGGRGGHQSPREIWTSGRSNARACSVRGFLSAYCSIICVLKLDSDGKAGGSHPSLGSHPGPVVFVASETRRDDDGLRLL